MDEEENNDRSTAELTPNVSSLSRISREEIDASLLRSSETNQLNMQSLLDRAHTELELSRKQSEELLAHKNHTIEQLSQQVLYLYNILLFYCICFKDGCHS